MGIVDCTQVKLYGYGKTDSRLSFLLSEKTQGLAAKPNAGADDILFAIEHGYNEKGEWFGIQDDMKAVVFDKTVQREVKIFTPLYGFIITLYSVLSNTIHINSIYLFKP